MGWLYRIKHKITHKAYIGQTIRPIEKRIEEHRKGTSKECRRIYNAIKKYGWDAFEIEWYECPDEDLNDHEEFLVEVLGTLSPRGYNLMEGGGSRGKDSDETKQKKREMRLGTSHSMKTKQKIGRGNRGKIRTDEMKQKNREAHLGKPGNLGEKNLMSKRVYQYNLDGTFINSFGSAGEAGRHLKKEDSSNIRACACYKSKTAYGFKWSYTLNIFM